jgi:cell division protein FtsB
MRVHVIKSPVSPTRLIKPLMWMFMAFYLGYHALHGERGLYALMRENHELSKLEAELKNTQSEREKMELRVSHLRDGSLDRDLLDEQMRRMMGVMKNGEMMLLTGGDRSH